MWRSAKLGVYKTLTVEWFLRHLLMFYKTMHFTTLGLRFSVIIIALIWPKQRTFHVCLDQHITICNTCIESCYERYFWVTCTHTERQLKQVGKRPTLVGNSVPRVWPWATRWELPPLISEVSGRSLLFWMVEQYSMHSIVITNHRPPSTLSRGNINTF